jgi:hypothetical protein
MPKETRTPHVDEDGVRVFDDGGRRRVMRARFVVTALVIAVVTVVALSATAVLILRRDPGTRAAGEPSPPPVQGQEVAMQPGQAMAPRAVPKFPAARLDQVAKHEQGGKRLRPPPIVNPVTDRTDDPPRDSPASAAAEQEHRRVESLARDVVQGLKASGETRGIAAFPPPGTDPIKKGLVVPENFPLPEGYVRHYQITDDGKRLEPILMFSPDYQFVDANGQQVAVPDDGIVPPSMAPPGLPLRTLELPKSSDTAGSRADGR